MGWEILGEYLSHGSRNVTEGRELKRPIRWPNSTYKSVSLPSANIYSLLLIHLPDAPPCCLSCLLLCLNREVIYVNGKLFLINWFRVCLYVCYTLSHGTFTWGLGQRYSADCLNVIPTAVWQMALVITRHLYVHTFIYKNFWIQSSTGRFSIYPVSTSHPWILEENWNNTLRCIWWNSSRCT